MQLLLYHLCAEHAKQSLILHVLRPCHSLRFAFITVQQGAIYEPLLWLREELGSSLQCPRCDCSGMGSSIAMPLMGLCRNGEPIAMPMMGLCRNGELYYNILDVAV